MNRRHVRILIARIRKAQAIGDRFSEITLTARLRAELVG